MYARIAFAIIILALATGAVVLSLDYGERARLAPLVVGIPMIALTLIVLVREFLAFRAGPEESAPAVQEAPGPEPGEADAGVSDDRAAATTQTPDSLRSVPEKQSEGTYWQALTSLAVLLAIFYVFGSIVTALVYPPVHMLVVGRFRWKGAIAGSVVTATLVWLVVDMLLSVNLYGGIL